jgi:3-deoxy-D-manno-octulosonic acid (KDO) 8-phosphate synthase
MKNHKVKCSNFEISNDKPFTLIAGPCQLESENHALKISNELRDITKELGINLIYKTSFDKANRTSLKGKRGIGLDKSLSIFDRIRKEVGVPVLTDVHTADQCSIVSNHVDVLQIPAFLCRQTDLLIAAAKTGKIINVKKGQFLAPWDMGNVIKKIEDSGNKNILITERRASFGL